jgi:hypothetical protein
MSLDFSYRVSSAGMKRINEWRNPMDVRRKIGAASPSIIIHAP